ncbi:glycosyltransferase [Nocardioides mangrovicus]|uniref:Glycosyltransferase n=2 Tax=Nocardioides mangrovicus TaxID=2478913 RepID=A0A3L8NXI4_9ACTN|nr:glycosyltransferase [Nocardioides mangrovicus]
MARAYPDATIHTLLYHPEETYPEFRDLRVVTSPLDRVGAIRRNHRAALPLMSWAAEQMHVDADVVLVSSSGWAHGFGTAPHTRKLVYCHNPARWLYQSETYLGHEPGRSAKGLALMTLRRRLVAWDKQMAGRADRYLANSQVVRERIRSVYGIDAPVLPPPHALSPDATREPVPALADWAATGFHLVVSRLLPYKNVDRAIAAFEGFPAERLVVVGDGPERRAIEASLPGNVRLVSHLSDAQMRWCYAHCTALVAPSIEDFGLTPLEGGAFGRPTLALRGGGYLDTVREGVTGLFFDTPTAARIQAAVVDNQGREWDDDAIRQHVDSFSEEQFAKRLDAEVAALAGDG